VTVAVSNLREYAYLRLDPCAYCGGPGGTIDHIVARAAGAAPTAGNLTGACPACNEAKGRWPLWPFLLLRGWASAPRERMVT
jgi:5-methylcytosine-specific restriction endonuclease McrA